MAKREQQQQIKEHPTSRASDKQAPQVTARSTLRPERSIESQAARLGDRRASSAQRQAAALRMGRTQGNRHVQRVVSSMHSQKHAAVRTPAVERAPEETSEGLGSSGTPSMAGAWPPDPLLSGRSHRLQSAPSLPVVQRDLVDDARAAARGLLNRLTGQADNEGREIENQSSTSVTQVDSEARTQSAQLQTGAQAQSTQVEALATHEQADVESQADVQSAQIESQAATAESTLQGQWSSVESEASALSSGLEGQAAGKTAELTGEAQSISNQVVERWNTREGETTSEMSTLEQEARRLYGSTQERARQLLDRGEEQDVDSAAQTIENAWSALLGRILPFQESLGRMWDTMTRWFRTLLQPLVRRLRQFTEWVTRQVAALTRHIRALWSRVAQIARRAQQMVRNVARRARQLLQRVASAALGRMRRGARRILRAARQTAVRIGRLLRRITGRLVSRLQQKASRAVGSIQRGISRIARFLLDAARRIMSGLRGIASDSLSRLREVVRGAADTARDLKRRILGGLRDLGSRAASSVREAGTRVVGTLANVGEAALRGLGVVWRGVQGAWQGLQGRSSGLFDRLRAQASSLAGTLRDRLLRPMWDGIRSRWQALRENVRFGLGRLLRGWRRLVDWGRSARARAQSDDPQVQETVLGEAHQRAQAPFESVFYKRQPGSANGAPTRDGAARQSVTSTRPLISSAVQKGMGHPLDSGVRSRFESAFGRSFGDVEIHRGTDAAHATQQADARALTVGTEIAFAQGEYQPGTPVGDALIAHELAHVIQQNSNDTAQRAPAQENEIETDADRSAIGAVAALWTGARDAAGRIAQNALPRLRSGLRLSSCRRGFPEGVPKPKVTFSPVHVGGKLPQDVHRIPPGKATPVTVQIEGWQDSMPPIVISGAGASGGRTERITVNGEPETEIEANGAQTVEVAGTQPPTSQSFRLIAKSGNVFLAEGQSFYIAAHPSGVTFSFSSVMPGIAHEGKKYWGAIYGLTISSDSGNAEDLALVEATEMIQKQNPTGFFKEIPLQRSGFRPALSPHPDHHGVSFGSSAAFKSIIDTDAGSTGEQVQYLRFAGGGAGITRDYDNGPIIPNSGFKISLQVTKKEGRYYLHVSKQGFANNGASAGTVTGQASHDIEVV